MTQMTNEPSKDDLALQGKIKDAFTKELSGAEIFVTVLHGVVTLDGDVASVGVRTMAEQIARGFAGDLELVNKIEADGPGGPQGLIMNQNLHPIEDTAPLSEASNTGDVSLHHPTTTDTSETLNSTVDGPVGVEGGATAYFAPAEGVPSMVPMTGSGPMSVMDAGAVDAMKVSGSELDDEKAALSIKEGMPVLDLDGVELGRVKTVRSTDFHLHRPLFSRDYYVPYFQCTVDEAENVVRVNIHKSELGDQGWAFPT